MSTSIRVFTHCFQATACALVTLTAATGQSPTQDQSVDLTFGVYTTDKPTVMYRTFTPVIEVLQKRLEEQLRREVSIELRIFKTYDKARAALLTGAVDFARFGPASYVLAKQQNDKIGLLAVETKDGKKTFKGYIVVRANSSIRKLSDLRGKRFAFGDQDSTIGRYLAQEALIGAGLHAKDLAKFEFLGRHDKVFTAVDLARFDAGALKSGTFHKLNRRNSLRVLVSFDNVTKPWVCKAAMAPDLRLSLTKALVSIRDKSALGALKCSSLVAAHDEDYDTIRKSMAIARNFEAPTAKPAPKPPAPQPPVAKTPAPRPK